MVDGNSDIVHSRDGDDDFGLEKNVGSSVPDTSLREGVKRWAGGPSNRAKATGIFFRRLSFACKGDTYHGNRRAIEIGQTIFTKAVFGYSSHSFLKKFAPCYSIARGSLCRSFNLLLQAAQYVRTTRHRRLHGE
jgi:hypothetical protein